MSLGVADHWECRRIEREMARKAYLRYIDKVIIYINIHHHLTAVRQILLMILKMNSTLSKFTIFLFVYC